MHHCEKERAVFLPSHSEFEVSKPPLKKATMTNLASNVELRDEDLLLEPSPRFHLCQSETMDKKSCKHGVIIAQSKFVHVANLVSWATFGEDGLGEGGLESDFAARTNDGKRRLPCLGKCSLADPLPKANGDTPLFSRRIAGGVVAGLWGMRFPALQLISSCNCAVALLHTSSTFCKGRDASRRGGLLGGMRGLLGTCTGVQESPLFPNGSSPGFDSCGGSGSGQSRWRHDGLIWESLPSLQ